MANGFDQFLANQIGRKGVLQVVTDPALADAIVTDRVGKPFEMRMEELYPEPKPEEPAPKEEDEEGAETKVDMKGAPNDRVTSFGRGKGTIFLVNRSSRNVIWSIYARPRTSQADDLDDTARDVAGQLTSAINSEAKAVATGSTKKTSWWHK